MPKIIKPKQYPPYELRVGKRNSGKTFHMVKEFMKTSPGNSIILCTNTENKRYIKDIMFRLIQTDWNYERNIYSELSSYDRYVFTMTTYLRGYRYKNVFVDDYDYWDINNKRALIMNTRCIEPNIYFYSSILLNEPYEGIEGTIVKSKFNKVTYLNDRNN